MIQITPDIALDERELKLQFIRAAGPGGQNVNKVATAVQLRFRVADSPSLPVAVRARLTEVAGNRINAAGEMVITARRFRTQDANRRDAVDRLVQLIRRAAKPQKKRRPTRPSKAVKRRRLDAKRRQADKKRGRRADFSRD